MEELKKLKYLSKEVLEKEHHKKINSLCCVDEKKEATKFLLLSHIKLKHLELEELINESKDHQDFHFLSLKSSLIPPKISLLQQDFQEKDFKKILTLLDEIELRLLNNNGVI